MKILAFSDWRVQDIEQFIDYLKNLIEKPDVIVYAGDDIRRFNRVPYKFLPSELKQKYRERLINKYELLEGLDKKTIDDIIQRTEIKNEGEINDFAKIANLSKYGLCVVAGNDDRAYLKKAIIGKNVYDIHDKPIIINNFAIIGLEGATGEIGSLLYTEREVEDHLEDMMSQIGDKQLIVVSHPPPFGILDFAMRFGKRHIGSTSLRDFIEKYFDKIKIVISGHVHRQGGRSEKYCDTLVVNCASHDSYGSPGLIAKIDISHNKINIKWEKLYGLKMIPFVGPVTARILREHGIKHVKQLAALGFNHRLSQKIGSFYIINKYAKAITSNEIMRKQGLKSIFDGIERNNIYFFDAEYDPSGTSQGPYGIFLLGWMERDGTVKQLFLDNPKEELRMLKDFNQWVEKEKPLFVAYGSRTADVPQLSNSYNRFKLSFRHLENSFFDLYSDLLYTRNRDKQKIFLPVTGSFGLKNVSKFLGYPQSDLIISEGIEAPIEYEKYLRMKERKEKAKIKDDLLCYNRDDLKRTKFIYDIIKDI